MKRLALFFIILFTAINCYTDNPAIKKPITDTASISENKTYNDYYKEVSKLINKGLPKSALKVIEEIYAKAVDEKDKGEIIKALVHKIYYLQRVEEETLVKVQETLQAELEKSTGAQKSLLHSMIAEQYWRYYQQNRYRFLNRSKTIKFKKNDMRTWDLNKIVSEVVGHYKNSLKNEKELKKTKVGLYNKILYNYQASRKLRPTLYDFLAHRAIDFFMNSEAGLTKPAFQFVLNSQKFFEIDHAFAKISINTKEKLSFDYFAITLFQKLIKFHIKDQNQDALLDVDVKRLGYVYRKAVLSNKAKLYEEILKKTALKYEGNKEAAEYYYQLASLYNKQGNNYRPGQNNDFRWHKKKAVELCKDTIKKYSGSYGANRCASLINQIKSREIKITFEKTALPGRSFRSLLDFRNINKLYLKVVKTSRKELQDVQRKYNYKKQVNYYIKKQAYKKWKINIPDDKDFQNHSCEIKIKKLVPGKYVVLAANGKDFNLSKDAVTYSVLDVSKIAYIQRKRRKQALEFYVVSRESGQPLKNASIQSWYRKWDRKTRKYYDKKGELFKADKKGYFNIEKSPVPGSNYFNLEFKYGKDRLFPYRSFYVSRPYNYFRIYTNSFFFLDRSIYRPGQTVFFKGIKLRVDSRNGEKNQILKNSSAYVTLYDVNRQKVTHLNLKTNEYGTYSGSFKIPRGLLNGQMRISDGYGNAYFSVEEYKRPKFEISFQPIAGSYRVNDTITLKGNAKSFAGYNIDNAKVSYRVVRNVRYLYSWYWWYYRPGKPAMEIINGQVKTDAKGEFKIKFKAIPDLTIDQKSYPAFNYTIYIDVTDLNGETRSNSRSVSAGYTALIVTASVKDKISKDDKNYKYYINSTNLSGDFVKAKGKINVYRLQSPKRIFRNRLWKNPDKHIIEKVNYYKEFPVDLYADELNHYKWKKAKKVFSSSFNTAKSKEYFLKNVHWWKSGKYLVELNSKDRFGNKIKDIRYFTLYSTKDKKTPYKMFSYFAMPKNNFQPGDNAEILIGSAQKKVRVLYEIEYRGRIISKKFITLNNEQKKIVIPIKEKHRGNLGVHFIFVKHNRVMTYTQNIYVPWTNKLLDISYETFRNKLVPGQKEEWRLKIKGKKKDQVAAEMVAALYDASLDQFRQHSWGFNVFAAHYPRHAWQSNDSYRTGYSRLTGKTNDGSWYSSRSYDRLNWFGFYWYRYYRRSYRSKAKNGMVAMNGGAVDDKESSAEMLKDVDASPKKLAQPSVAPLEESKRDSFAARVVSEDKIKTATGKSRGLSAVKARTNFNETAFFYPHLKTNQNGEIIISFTIPESLTKWKLLGFAHTKNLEYGITTNSVVTQKELMVVPNSPRFFRENDTIYFSAKITNLTDKLLKGKTELKLFDASNMQPVDTKFININKIKSFEAKKGQSALVNWKIKIPEDVGAVTYKVVAAAGKYSDGEEKALPILKNRMLVTETMPLPIRSLQTKTFKFKKLINSGMSNTLKHHKLTLEFTSNPAWYAVQALPYLMEYPYECLEQTFNRFYANSIAQHVVKTNPKIKKVFDVWKKIKNSNALLSNLEKNQELKAVLLEQTPWVLNAKNETERKKRISLLFDINRMADELGRALNKISKDQRFSGAWPWFNGMDDDRYITQYIVSGFAHLQALKVIDVHKNVKIWRMLNNAIAFLDVQLERDYNYLLKHGYNLKNDYLGYMQIHYLYARSYFKDIKIRKSTLTAFNYYKTQAVKYWVYKNRYAQGMLALALFRYEDKKTPSDIVKSIKEHAIYSEEMGMYWKDSYGFYWYQARIESHALMVELFHEVTGDAHAIDDLKTWLLKQKQTQDWRTTKATADACYALLLGGDNWLKYDKLADITLGSIKVEPNKMDNVKVEAGTGYFKTSWSGSDIKPEMGNVKVVNNNKVVAWGGLYWQYFEQLDKITPHATPLKLKKKLFVERRSASGPVLIPITKEKLKVGDRIKVRIVLRVDRAMEYVHIKDMRASAFEPENVISRAKHQDGLWYYESTKDASTDFFIGYLPKGTFVFEYPMRVTHRGNFSNGITTIQCMYAPEFASHSEGVRVNIK